MKKYVFACPKCGAFYGGEGGALEHRCECGAKLNALEMPYSQWEAMSQEERKKFKRCYCEKMGIAPKQAAEPKSKIPRYEPIQESGWVSWLGCCGWLVVGAGVVLAIGMIANGGILIVPVVILVAVLSASGFMVLKGVAEDTRRIINEIGFFEEKYYRNMEKAMNEIRELKQMLREQKENAENEN